MATKATALKNPKKSSGHKRPKPVAAIPDKSEDERAKQIPVPCGYKILIALPVSKEKTDGGILKADITRRAEEVGSIVGFVHSMGPDAYSDKKRFPHGAYCKVGDFIIMRAYAGTRLIIHGTEWRILNDDSIDAVVQDPSGIVKA